MLLPLALVCSRHVCGIIHCLGRTVRSNPRIHTISRRRVCGAIGAPQALFPRFWTAHCQLDLKASDPILLNMPADSAQIALERVLAAVGQCLDRKSAEALLRLRADAEMQGRIEKLADKSTEGKLTPEERDEYEAMIRVGNFVAILQAKARRLLAEGHAA
jgi:hypothetical protein